MNLGIFADGIWGLNFLKKIKKNKKFSIKYVCGRKKIDKNIKKFTLKNKIPFFAFNNLKSNFAFKKIVSFNTDLLVSMSYDQIFNNKIINMNKYPPINCHAGMLPKYRGRNVINWAIINGEKELGITVHQINNKIDKGNIISQKKIKILESDNYKTILSKCHNECPNLLLSSLNKIYDNPKFNTIPQKNLGKGFYCKKRTKGDEIINLNNKTKYLNNFIRGITYPGPNAQYKNGRYKIHFIKSRILNKQKIHSNYKVGEIINFKKKYFDVRTKDGAIRILKWKTKTKLYQGLILK
jgi:methionyl-tRNA formyltransferase